ncbi:MAG: MSCRAMM family protein, partial [Planctomycetota bacterium]
MKPSQSKRILFLLALLLIAGGAVLFLVLRSFPEGEEVAVPGAGPQTSEGESPASPDGRKGSGTPSASSAPSPSPETGADPAEEIPPTEKGAASLRGWVSDLESNPIPGARVALLQEEGIVPIGHYIHVVYRDILDLAMNGDTVLAETTTDEAGEFAFSPETAGVGAYGLRVSASGFAPTRVHAVKVEAGIEPKSIEIKLPPPFTASGRVLDGAGSPVAEAAVALVRFAFVEGLTYLIPFTTRTGEDGRFRMTEVRAGRYALLAWKKGLSTHAEMMMDVPQKEEFEIRLEVGFPLEGKVLDESTGKPLAGQTLYLRDRNRRWPRYVHRMKTDEGGAFRIEHIAPGQYDVFVFVKGYAPFGLFFAHAEPGTVLADFRLARGFTVSGRAVDAVTGEGLPGVTVCSQAEGPKIVDRVRTKTGPNGTFTLEGATVQDPKRAKASGERGSLALFAYKEGWVLPAAVKFEAPGSGLLLADVRIPLHPAPEASGRIVDDEGKPVAGAKLWMVCRERDRLLGTYGIQRHRKKERPVSDGEGRFRIELPVGGKVQLHVRHEAYIPFAREFEDVGPGGDVTDLILTLARGGAIRGVVVDGKGKPLTGVFVGCQFQGTLQGRSTGPPFLGSRSANTDEGGGFLIRNLKPGPWKVVLTGMKAVLPEPVHVEVRKAETVEVRLEAQLRTLTIEGVVVDENGAPAGGVSLWAGLMGGGGNRVHAESLRDG